MNIEYGEGLMQHQINNEPKSTAILTSMHILVLFACALGIRLYLWQSFPHVIFLHEADGMGYISIARNVIENFSINNATHFPPFYPALIALFSLVSGSYENGARFASIFMGAGLVVPFYLAGRFLMSARAAFCAALFAACFGPFIDYSLQPVSQATYIGLIALALWLGLRCVTTPNLGALALFGMTSAAIYLTRPEGILFFAINLPMLIYVIYTQHSKPWQRLKQCGLLIFSFLLPLFWYVTFLKRFTGNWTISGKSGVTTIGVDASMKIVSGGQTYGEMTAGTAGLADLVPSLSRFIATYTSQLGKFVTVAATSLSAIICIVAIVGIVVLVYELFSKNNGQKKRTLCIYWMFLSPLVMLLPVMAFDKISVATGYILPFFMVLFFFSGKGMGWLEMAIIEWFGKLRPLTASAKRRIPLAVITSLLLSWSMLLPLYQWLSSNDFNFMSRQQDFLLRTTGRWFVSNTDKTAKLMARWSNIGYYGDRGWIGLADGSIGEVTEFARRHGVTHIVIDSNAVPRRRPQLVTLLDPSLPHPGLTPVYADEQFETRVIIYQVN